MAEAVWSPARADRRVWVARALLIAALTLLLAHLAIYVHYAVGLLRFPFDYDQGEGFELQDTILFSRGEWPYRDNETYPFYASNYPPLFHVILAPCVWLFGAAYWYGRLAGFLGTLITAGAIGWLVWRAERQRTVAALAGLAFLASNTIYHIGPLFRQHMTMVLFETLCVVALSYAFDLPDGRRRRVTTGLGLLALLAAGFTKQLALATAVAVFAWLFIRSPRRALAWGVVFAAVAGALFAWINWATDGAWWTNIIAANVNEYFPAQFVGLLRQWLRLHGALVIPAALLVLYELYFARLSLLSVWWIFAVADSALAGKWGAGDSYFATAIAATCALAGIFVARSLRGGWTFSPNYLTRAAARLSWPRGGRGLGRAVGALTPALFVIYGLSVVKLPTEGRFFGPLADALGLESSYGARYAFYDSAGWTPGYATIGHVPTAQDEANGWRIVDLVRASAKPVMSEEAAFSLRAGKDVVTNPTQLKNLYENDLFDPGNLVAAIERRDFGLIIFRAQFYPPPVLDAVYRAYYPAELIPMNGFDYEIWRPGPERAARDMVAAALAEPGAAVEVRLDLPPDQALLWLDHAAAYHGWTPIPSDQTPTDPGCAVRRYAREAQETGAEVCVAGQGAAMMLGGAG